MKRKPRRAQADRREETRASLLDAAEKLFAEHGRDGVTVRMLGEEAGVTPALVHYYFDDLEGVYRSVFQRKADVLNPIRDRKLDEYLAAHRDNLTIEGLFDVFLRPVFETMSADPAYWANYAAIVAHVNTLPAQGGEYMRKTYDVTVHRFIDVLIQIAPEVPRAEIYWFYHLLSGAQVVTLAQTGRVDFLSKGLCKSANMTAALRPMIRLFTAGFKELRAEYANAPSKNLKPVKPRAPKAVAA